MRLSTPPLASPFIVLASADEEDASISYSKVAGVKPSASMDFDMLFDIAEGASGANEHMETVHEDAKEETYSSSDDDVLDPVSVYVRCAPSPPVPSPPFKTPDARPLRVPNNIGGVGFSQTVFFPDWIPTS